MDRINKSMRDLIEHWISDETVARKSGLLQKIPAWIKTLGAFAALILIATTPSFPLLAGIAILVILAAVASRAPVGALLGGILLLILSLGVWEALSMPGAKITGPPAAYPFGLGCLRLGTGVGLCLLWSVTTRRDELIRTLRLAGVPCGICVALALSYRYLLVLLETVVEIAVGRKSRQFGKSSRTRSGEILFGKSRAYMEHVKLAMKSRGFGLTFSMRSPAR